MISSFEQGLALVENTMQQHPVKSKAYLTLAGFWRGGRLVPGLTLQPVTDPSHALSVLRKGVALWERFVKVHPAVTGFQLDLSKFYDVMKNQQLVLGRQEDALRSIKRVLDIREMLVRDHPGNVNYKSELSYGYLHLAVLLVGSEPRQAEELFHREITVQQAVHQPYHKNLANMHTAFAKFLQRSNRPDEAIEEYQKATPILEKMVEKYPHIIGYQSELAYIQRTIADLLKSVIPGVAPKPNETQEKPK